MALTVFTSYQQRVEQKMAALLHAEPIPMLNCYRQWQYSLLSGGKRIRPFLVYSCGQMFGASLEDLDAPAMATEVPAYLLSDP